MSKNTYVIRIDWFSRSLKKRISFWLEFSYITVKFKIKVISCTHQWAWTDRHCQRWRRCGGEPQPSFCLCTLLQPPSHTLGATCRGSLWHRTAQSRSVEKERIYSNTPPPPVTVHLLMRRSGQTHVDHPCCITLFEVIQHRGFTEVGHHGHVLNLVKLWRVHGEDFGFFDGESLWQKQHRASDLTEDWWVNNECISIPQYFRDSDRNSDLKNDLRSV